MGKRILRWALLVVFLVALCLLLFRADKTPRQTIQRADGSVVTLIDVTYGTNNTIAWGNSFQRLLYKMLPQKLKGYSRARELKCTSSQTNVPVFWVFDSRPQTNSPVMAVKATTNSLTVVRSVSQGVVASGSAATPPAFAPGLRRLANRPGQNLIYRVLDEFGCEHDTAGWGMGSTYLGLEGTFSYFQMNLSDPHGKIVGLALYDSDSKTNEIGRFLISGAAFKPLPKFPADKISAPQQDGDMSFKLVSLVTGLMSEPIINRQMSNSIPFSHATFRITKNGVVVSNWFPFSLEITDAKGKHLPSIGAYGRGFEDGNEVKDFQGFLDPADGPYKIRVEFTHVTGFSPDELVTFKDVPFPEDSQVLTNNLIAEAGGHQVKLEMIYGANSDMPTNHFQKIAPFIQASVSPFTNSIHLILQEAIDENGEEMQRWGMVSSGRKYQFNFAPKTHAKTATLTFAIYQNLHAEFEAMPMVVSTNEVAKK